MADLSSLGLDESVVREAIRNPKVRDALEELQRRKIEEPYRVYAPMPHQRPFHADQSRVRLVAGGNRSGKTRAGAQEAIWHALGDHPFRDVPKRSEGWVVSEDSNVLRDVQLPYFFSLLPPRHYRWYESDKIAEITAGEAKGNTIGFKSVDSGWPKFQGTARDWVWFDEEPKDERVYNECRARLIDRSGSHWITWTPLYGQTWLYKRLWLNEAEERSLGRHIFWSERNTYLPAGELAAAFAGMSEEEKRVRLYGEFIPLSGRPVFSRADLDWHLARCRPGRLGLMRWVDEPNGRAAFYTQPLDRERDFYVEMWEPPEPNHDYAVGSDIAEGLVRGDASSAEVRDRHTGRQVAAMYGRVDAALWAEELFRLGSWYNAAVLCPERNSIGLVVLQKLKELAYPRIYVERVYEKGTHDWRESLGFRTGERSKRTAIALVQIALSRRVEGSVRDRALVEEMRKYVRDEKGKMGAESGFHDDRVSARWLVEVAHNDESAPEELPVKQEEDPGESAWIWRQIARERERAAEDRDSDGPVYDAEDEYVLDEDSL